MTEDKALKYSSNHLTPVLQWRERSLSGLVRVGPHK